MRHHQANDKDKAEAEAAAKAVEAEARREREAEATRRGADEITARVTKLQAEGKMPMTPTEGKRKGPITNADIVEAQRVVEKVLRDVPFMIRSRSYCRRSRRPWRCRSWPCGSWACRS